MKRTVCLFLLPYVCAVGAWAQAGAGAGAVSGTVKEAAGDGLPDVTVELSNPALGLKRLMTTTDDGLFTAPALNPAAGYHLKMTHRGYEDWQSADFEVFVGQTLNFQVTMKHTPGTAKYDEGTIPTPEVREWKAGTSTVVTPAQLAQLPAASRHLDPIVTIAPFVSRDNTGRVVIDAQARSNAFLEDGILTTNTYYEERPRIAPQLTLDSIQELQVVAGNYAPEFGGALGGIVNAATRGGTSAVRGSLYEYFDSANWNAARVNGLGLTSLGRQNDFGASVGGPIRSGKLFYFANAEVRDGSGFGVNRLTSDLLSPANCKATAAQCAAASLFLQKQNNVPVSLSGRTTTGLARIDYRRSDRNQFTLIGNAMNGRGPGGPLDQVAPGGGLLGLIDSTEQVRYGKLGWTSAPTDNSVNEFRFGHVEDRLSNPASQAGLSTGNIGLIVAGANVGNPRPDADSLKEHRNELVENFTATSNTHTFRLGADLWENVDYVNGMNAAGAYVYNSLTTFAQDFGGAARNYSYFTQDFGTSSRKLSGRQYNTYAMDTWRPVRHMTIVAGVRWEKARRPQPSEYNTNYYLTGKIAAPMIDFAPRISIAYQSDPHTVLRFGYFWSYEPLPGQAIDALYLGNGVYQTNVTVNPNQSGAPIFPNVLAASAIPAGTTNLIYGSTKLRDPRLEQYTASLERTIGKDTTLTFTGIREHGVDLWTMADQNLTAPTVTKTYAIDNAGGSPVDSYATSLWTARQDARYAHVYNVFNGGSYWHTAASVELRKRMAHGVSMQASYTWSKALDNVGGPLIDGVFPLSLTGDGTAPRASSATDQRQRFVLNWIWQPTVTHSSSAALRRVLNGWAISGIGMVGSGLPVVPEVLVAGQQFAGTTMTYTTSLNGTGGWSRVPFPGTGTLNTGRQYNLDARVSRTVDFTERLKAVVLFEAFNALNSSYTLGLNSIAYQSIPTAPPTGTVNGPQTGVLHPVNGFGTASVLSDPRRAQIAFRLVF